jgi:hypothetical protein
MPLANMSRLLAVYIACVGPLVAAQATTNVAESLGSIPTSGTPECGNRTSLYVAVNPEVIPFTFKMRTKDGTEAWAGMDIELLLQLAYELDLCLKFNEKPATVTAQDLIDDVNDLNTTTNMAVGAITVTGKRLEVRYFHEVRTRNLFC